MPIPKPDDAAYCAATGCLHWSRKWGARGLFLCGTCWRRLTKRERAAMRRIWRTIKKLGGWKYVPEDMNRREWRIWEACVRRAGDIRRLAMEPGQE